MGWLARMLGKRRRPAEPGSDATFERLAWLDPPESPFGVRVLDCRPIADKFLSASERPFGAAFLHSPAARSGEQFRGSHPEDAARVPCRLDYPEFAPPPEGPVFLAAAMEDKWNVYRLGGALYFVRSWTGQLVYVATLAEAARGWGVVEVEFSRWAAPGPPEMGVRQVDYLVKSHLYGFDAPHPVPAVGDKKLIALWSFNQYGRRGRFAAPELPSSTSAVEPRDAPDAGGENG